ncbi:MAG TPA: enoyl-CoA hydratase/isomerase family protein [Alphaproteobacteria bacterium]|nr:enoyl-CoA hydratase/isomerase family protein [Alphaproteobacteria bacterium]
MTEAEILFETRGPLGLVTLNRPKALNALTLGMAEQMLARLGEWMGDPAIQAVVVRGAGDRAFCAGGDVRAVWDAGSAQQRGPGSPTDLFFRTEYRLNRRIHRFPKPYVALIDGITMGGGVGLSVHGSHRVATERTLFAMPETGIGLFPDVGGSYFLNRCPGATGTWMALTGARLGAGDLCHARIASHVVASAALDTLVEELAGARWSGHPAAVVEEVLSRHHAAPPPAAIPQHRATIDRCFSGDTVEGILACLDADSDPWAAEQAAILRRMSPTSLKVTLAQLRRAADLPFDDCMVMEFRMSQACMAGHDFYEGIRALLVDKDKNPKWSPATLEAVDAALVERHFAPLGAHDLSFA